MLRIRESHSGQPASTGLRAVQATHFRYLGPVLAGLCTAAFVPIYARAATWGGIGGTLAIRAGDNPQQFSAVTLGSPNLADSDFTIPDAGFHQATSSVATTRLGGYQLNFSGVANSVTSKNAAAGTSNATASLSFSQSFTTVSPQWLEITARVSTRKTVNNVVVDDPDVAALLTVTRTGQPTPIFTQGESFGAGIARRGFFPAGTYTVQGSATTAAKVLGAHSGVIDGSVLIASLADFNGDFVVGAGDLATLRSNFGSTTGLFANGDADGNGRTDGNDILLLQRQIGTSALPPIAQGVPEPASAALAAAVLAAVGNYCRTRRSAARRASASPAR